MPKSTGPARALSAYSANFILFFAAASLTACAGSPADDAATSLYALVEGIDGVYFLPPLGPEPTVSGAFEATLLDGLSVTIEAEDTTGQVTPLAAFDASTTPHVALLAEHERYWVNIPAATYLTDPAKIYRIRALLDGSELGSSVLSAHVFEVLAYNPDLPIGVAVRIEGSGAVRAVARTRHQSHGAPAHCSDGVRNKDETGVDCGGSTCAPCCIPAPETCNGLDDDCDGVVDNGNPGGNASCATGLLGACGAGTTQCIGGALACIGNVAAAAETCNGRDDNCDGIVDNLSGCVVPRVAGWAINGASQFFGPTQDGVAAEYCSYLVGLYHFAFCITMEASDIAFASGTGPSCDLAGQRIVRAFSQWGTCRGGPTGSTPVPWSGTSAGFTWTDRCPAGTLASGSACRVYNPSLMTP